MSALDPRSFTATILRASYEGVVFPVEVADTNTSHDGLGHKAYLVAGADFEPTGLNEDSGTLTVPMWNDIEGMQGLWPEGAKRLIQTVKSKPLGRLTHPTRGTMEVFISAIRESASAMDRDGVRLTIQWSQHNGNSTDVTTDPTRAPDRQSRAAAQLAAQRLDDEIVALGNPLLNAFLIAAFIAEQFALLDSAVQTAGSVRAIFQLMQDRCAEIRAEPTFSAALGFGVFGAASTLGSTLFGTMNAYIPGLQTATTITTQVTKTAWEIAEEAYGTTVAVGEILDANTITDPLAIPPGTALVIPPLPEGFGGRTSGGV